MKKFLIAATSLTALVAFAGSASAADPVVDLEYDWTGPYIGLQAGYGWGDSDTTTFDDTGVAFPGSDGSTNINGFIGGLHAGWNWQSDAIVFGIEADVNLANIDGTFTFANGDDFTTDVQATGNLRARLGFAMDRALIYATGGLAVADVELGAFDIGTLVREEDNKTYFGYTVGGGLEYAFTDALSARVEYRYTDLGEKNFNWATSFPAFNGDYDIDFHTVQAGLSWHF
jgi:outer membrane immunogenic protein